MRLSTIIIVTIPQAVNCGAEMDVVGMGSALSQSSGWLHALGVRGK